MQMRQRLALNGFTIVEMVVTIVVFGILAVGIAGFIASSSSGYVATGNRNQLSGAGRIAIDKISSELRNALPASVRISNVVGSTTAQQTSGDQCMEFIPVTAATTYIDPSFKQPGLTFNAVEAIPDLSGVSGLYAVIYPNKSNEIYQEPVPNKGPRIGVSSVVHNGDDTDLITLVGNHAFKNQSRVNRLFFTQEPVSFCVKGTRIYRYQNYGFSSSQLLPVGNNGACSSANCLPSSTPGRTLISAEIDNTGLNFNGASAFNQLTSNRQRNAVVQLQFNFSRSGDSVTLNHEVLLQTTP